MNVTVRTAKRSDIPAINACLVRCEYQPLRYDEKINHRDVSLVAVTEEGQVVGFLWVGLMAGNCVAYIDDFCVDPEYSGKGVGNSLALRAITEGKKRGARECFGVIKQGKYHDKSAINALKVAIGAHPMPYTYVCAQIDHMLSELKLGEENGRK